jgi:hypothetical protein
VGCSNVPGECTAFLGMPPIIDHFIHMSVKSPIPHNARRFVGFLTKAGGRCEHRLWNRGRGFCFMRPRIREGAMSDSSKAAWEKAAECEAHAQATEDGNLQGMFRKLRDSWIRVGNDAQLSEQIEENAKRLDEREAGAGNE